jgi:hypothetical protein
MEDCRITFYSIDRFGYYKRGQDNPEFGDLKDILDDLREWAFGPGMKLGQTCTYEISENSERVSYRTFCFDLVKDTGSNTYLLTTWNESPNSQGKVASVKGLDPVGNAEVNLSEIPEDYIPGYATYFWFVPGKDTFATLQFQHSFNGRRSLEAYLRGYLTKFSKHVASKTATINGSIHILGYQRTSNDAVRNDLYPQFNSRWFKKAGQHDFIRSNWNRIHQIIRKDTLVFSVEQDRSFFEQLVQKMGINGNISSHEEFERFQFSLNHHPSEQEVDEMIRSWEEHEHDTKWDDLGFKLEGEDSPYWLSHSLPRNIFSLDVSRKNDEIIDSQSLLNQLVANQKSIFSLLDSPLR